MKIVILAGGSGTRLWPLSRERYPKQFLKLFEGKYSLFQETIQRSLLLSSMSEIYIVTNALYKHLVYGEIEDLGYPIIEKNIIVEPYPLNTLPAIASAVSKIVSTNNDHVLVLPSDHKISNMIGFAKLMNESTILSESKIITFGVKPNAPNTGYGYIQIGEPILNGFKVVDFKEKPNLLTAKSYISNGYLWNAGIFMFHSSLFMNELQKYSPEIFEAFKSTNNINDAFSRISQGISIDYGILEKSNEVVCVSLTTDWNDLGTFDSFHEILDKDDNLNSKRERDILLDTSNTIIYSDPSKIVTTIGVENLIVIDTKDALLVCKNEESQKVKQVIEELKKREDARYQSHLQDYRPWGNYTILEEERNEFKIKRIFVRPGKQLSYQYHLHRSEHWVVVRGVATVVIDGVEKAVPAGESVFIKAQQKHRLANRTNEVLEIIEVQLGDYLEEDDIIRLNDDFGRQ